jgi:hypothetical protein
MKMIFGFLSACGDDSAAGDATGSNPRMAAKSEKCFLMGFIIEMFFGIFILL